jgi:hypothetical protein
MVVATVPLMAQVTVGGLMDMEFRMSGSDSKPYVNGSPSPKPTLYMPNARLFVDAALDDAWSFFAVLQSDHYGSKTLNPPIFSMMQVTWTPFDADIAFHAGRIIIPFGLTSERFLSSENPLRHLPLSHEWTTRVDKKAGLTKGPRDYVLAPGMTFVYSRMYTHGIAMQGTFGMLDAHLALTQNAPSGFNEGGEYATPAFVGRVGLTPLTWTRVGASFGRGAYMRKDPKNEIQLSDADRASLIQTIYGVDATIDYRYLRLSYEYLRSIWLAADIDKQVVVPGAWVEVEIPAYAHSIEVVWDVAAVPGLHMASRYDRMTIGGVTSGEFERLETGFGYKLTRSVTVKSTYARARNQGTDLADDVFGVQLSITF